MRLLVKYTAPGRPTRKPRPSTNPKTGRRIADPKAKAAQDVISKIAALHFKGNRPYIGPCVLTARFVFAIPKSWPEYIKRAARDGRVMHVSDPDLDQLVKQVKDAMSGIVYVDDNQVCGYPGTGKRYGGPERTEIEVWALDQADDEITPGQKATEQRQLGPKQSKLI